MLSALQARRSCWQSLGVPCWINVPVPLTAALDKSSVVVTRRWKRSNLGGGLVQARGVCLGVVGNLLADIGDLRVARVLTRVLGKRVDLHHMHQHRLKPVDVRMSRRLTLVCSPGTQKCL